jgi:hypothetical protein
MNKKFEAEKAIDEAKAESEEVVVPKDDDPYEDDYDDYDDRFDAWDEEQATRNEHLDLCDGVREGEIEVTPELIQSVDNPDWKRELIEAICLRQVNKKEK